MAAGTPNRFSPGGFRGVRPPPAADEWERFSEFEKEQKRGEEWMKRASAWRFSSRPTTSKWTGEKLLGKGVAVFKSYSTSINQYHRVVVRQASSPEEKRSLEHDSQISLRLHNGKPYQFDDDGHILPLIMKYGEDAGTGTDDTFDPVYVEGFAPDTVGRSYTKYCEGGNFEQWLEREYSFSDYPSENDVWSVMQCMARMCMALQYGNETSELFARIEGFRPLVHLDIRPKTIFCVAAEYRQLLGEHSNRTRFMLGKFGNTAEVPRDPADPHWMWSIRGRADTKWATPEQKYPNMDRRNISLACNIFGIGALLYYMIKGKELDDHVWKIGISDSASDQQMRLYFGGDLVTEPISEQQEYSKTLIKTILRCLAYHPAERITTSDLFAMSNDARKLYRAGEISDSIRYTPGDPAIILKPQQEVEPNSYVATDLRLTGERYSLPTKAQESIRKRAEKWLSYFWIFPDSKKSLQARERQREAYEKERERKREEAEKERKRAEAAKAEALAQELARAKKEADEKAAAERAALEKAKKAQALEAFKEALRIKQEAEMRESLRKFEESQYGESAAIDAQANVQASLLPTIKRERSPDPTEEEGRKKRRSESPAESTIPKVTAIQDGGSERMDIDTGQVDTVLPLEDKGKEKQVTTAPAEIPSVSKSVAPTVPGPSPPPPATPATLQPEVSAPEARPKVPPKPPATSGAAASSVSSKSLKTSEVPKVPRDEQYYTRDNPRIRGNPDLIIENLNKRKPAKEWGPEFPWWQHKWWDGVLYNDYNRNRPLPEEARRWYARMNKLDIRILANSGTDEAIREGALWAQEIDALVRGRKPEKQVKPQESKPKKTKKELEEEEAKARQEMIAETTRKTIEEGDKMAAEARKRRREKEHADRVEELKRQEKEAEERKRQRKYTDFGRDESSRLTGVPIGGASRHLSAQEVRFESPSPRAHRDIYDAPPPPSYRFEEKNTIINDEESDSDSDDESEAESESDQENEVAVSQQDTRRPPSPDEVEEDIMARLYPSMGATGRTPAATDTKTAADADTTHRWWCPLCDTKDDGYMQLGRCKAHMKEKHRGEANLRKIKPWTRHPPTVPQMGPEPDPIVPPKPPKKRSTRKKTGKRKTKRKSTRKR